LEYIKSLPLNETPEVYSLHQNADLTALINEGMGLLRTAVSLMPRGASSAGNSTEEAFAEIAKDIERKIPSESFDVEAVERRYPSEYHESLNTVLTQELGRFNKLFYRMHSSVTNLQKAAKGLVVFSHELEEVGMAFLDQRQPLYWQKVSFLSLKPLGSYIIDFLKRLDFFQTWVNKGPPVVFWISGLFFPQAFLTGVLQNMARRDRVPIDTCIWNHRVEKAGRRHEEFQKPQKGCYVHGLYMEGAQWLDVEQCIGESSPKVLYTAMPVILFDPVVINAERSLRNQYECPTYKTSARKGVLSTTGHSTNFVTMVFLPIKEDQEQSYWVKRGVALLTQLDE
jgi:dynein heavy chain